MRRSNALRGLLAGGVVIVLVSAVTGQSVADSTKAPAQGSSPEGATFESLTVRNTRDAVRVIAEVTDLEQSGAGAGLVLDTGRVDALLAPRDPASADSGFAVEWAGADSRPELYRYAGSPYTYDRVSCSSMRGVWDTVADQVRLTVPQSCLGRDAGKLRAQLSFYATGDGPWGQATTRVLQRGTRGAAYFDVDGDKRADKVRQVSPRAGRYAVVVRTDQRRLSATAPRSQGVRWAGAPVFSSLDIDRNGRSEVVGDPADAAGDGAAKHLFTLVKGRLRLVRHRDGKPFRLRSAAANGYYALDFRCAGGVLQTWRTTAYPRNPTGTYTVAVTSWRFASGTARRIRTMTVRLPAWTVANGNWSSGSCQV